MSTHCFVLMNRSRCLMLLFTFPVPAVIFIFCFLETVNTITIPMGFLTTTSKPWVFFLGRINKTMSLGHGMAFISFLFFCYFSLILDIAIFSFRCLSLSLSLSHSLSLYIYNQASCQKAAITHSKWGRARRQFFIIYYWVKER